MFQEFVERSKAMGRDVSALTQDMSLTVTCATLESIVNDGKYLNEELEAQFSKICDEYVRDAYPYVYVKDVTYCAEIAIAIAPGTSYRFLPIKVRIQRWLIDYIRSGTASPRAKELGINRKDFIVEYALLASGPIEVCHQDGYTGEYWRHYDGRNWIDPNLIAPDVKK